MGTTPGAVGLCIEKYQDDSSMSLTLYGSKYFVNNSFIATDLTISMDIILHVIEDDNFSDYLAPHNNFWDHRPWVRQFAPNFTEIRSLMAPDELGYPDGAGFYSYSN